jgi:hypothetical protein
MIARARRSEEPPRDQRRTPISKLRGTIADDTETVDHRRNCPCPTQWSIVQREVMDKPQRAQRYERVAAAEPQ